MSELRLGDYELDIQSYLLYRMLKFCRFFLCSRSAGVSVVCCIKFFAGLETENGLFLCFLKTEKDPVECSYTIVFSIKNVT